MPSPASTVKMKGSNFFVGYNEYGKLKPCEKYIHVNDDLFYSNNYQNGIHRGAVKIEQILINTINSTIEILLH